MPDYLILGCGYTASRVARDLIQSGARVVVTNRDGRSVAGAQSVALEITDAQSREALKVHLSAGMVVLNSLSATNNSAELLEVLEPFRPERMVYISTTGVYGAAEFVDEGTTPEPNTERDRQRLNTEQLIQHGPWSPLILRPAAIYGPGRGVHTSARTGIFRPPPGGNRMISRIHVDDLAAQVRAGLQSQITGAFPVADEEPCTSLTVAEYAFSLLRIPFEIGEREATARDERKTGRRVDGSAFRKKAGLSLLYPSYREGVVACLEAEECIVAKA